MLRTSLMNVCYLYLAAIHRSPWSDLQTTSLQLAHNETNPMSNHINHVALWITWSNCIYFVIPRNPTSYLEISNFCCTNVPFHWSACSGINMRIMCLIIIICYPGYCVVCYSQNFMLDWTLWPWKNFLRGNL